MAKHRRSLLTETEKTSIIRTIVPNAIVWAVITVLGLWVDFPAEAVATASTAGTLAIYTAFRLIETRTGSTLPLLGRRAVPVYVRPGETVVTGDSSFVVPSPTSPSPQSPQNPS